MFAKLKFHYRLFILFSIFVFIILTISGIIFYSSIISLIETNVANNQRQTTQKTKEQLDGLLREMDQLSIQVNSSETIMEIFKNIPPGEEENYFDKNPRIRDAVRNVLFSFTSFKPIRGRISLISKNLDYVDLGVNTHNVTKDYIRTIPIFNEAIGSEEYKIYLPPHIDEWSTNKDIVFSVVRPLRDNFNVYGLVEVNYNLSVLDQICSFEDSSSLIKVALFDEGNQRLIYDNFEVNFNLNKNLLYNQKIAGATQGNYLVKNNVGNNKLIASFVKLENADWTLVLFEDMLSFRKSINYLSNTIVITYVLVFMVILLTLYFFTSNITQPLRQLKDSLSEIDIDSMKLVLSHNTTNNEITLLGKALQDLLNEAKTAMNKMIESRSREMHAHMMALQSELNPHFLYNTLTVIGAYGQKKGNTEVMEMCSILSEMLRYTAKVDEHNSNLGFEFKYIKNYLHLMSKRFEGFLEYHIDCDPSLNQIRVPKLILQPLVENTFQHAFKDQEPPWVIIIKGYIKQENWYVSIKDNGGGFNPVSLAAIQSKLKENKENIMNDQYSNEHLEGGLGLTNTFVRLMIFFEGTETIEFYNNPDVGTTIIIGGPIKKR